MGDESAGEGVGVHAGIGIEPRESCPAADLAGDYQVHEFVHGQGGNAPRFLVAAPDDPSDRPGVVSVLRTGDLVVCRFPELGDPRPTACDHGRCLARGLGFLPVQPYRQRWRDGRLHVDVATSDRGTVQSIVERLREAGFDASTSHITLGGLESEPETALVDLSVLTSRQREVAALAAEHGYFDPDGPPADAFADELDIAKATLSEHLRTAEAELLRQIFPGRDAD